MSDYLASGRLEDHPFADLAGVIFQENRTGELTLEGGSHRRTVWFLGGNPVALVSEDPQDHLSRFLLEHGKISEEDARRLAALPETREALGGTDILSKETLSWGVKSRFVNLCYELFRWEEGDYAFREGEPPRELFLLKVPAHSLIFKGVGFIGAAAVQEAVPDAAACGAGRVPAEDARYLGPDVRKLLDECQPGRTVGDVLGGGWDDVEQVRRLLYALVCLGLVSLANASGGAAVQAGLDEEPGFTLDVDVAEPPGQAPPPPPPTEEFTLPGTGAPGEFDLGLPPLDAEHGASAAPGSTLELGGSGPLGGGYSLDEAPGGGSFGSFGSGLAGDFQGTTEGAPDEADEAPRQAAKKPGGRLRVPHFVGIAIGSVAALGLIGFAGWWWLVNNEPPPPPVKPPLRRPATVPAPAVAPAPTPAPVAATPAQPVAPAPAQPSAPTPSAPVSAPAPPVAAPTPSAPRAPVAAPAPAPAAKAPEPHAAVNATTGNATDRYRNGLEVFRAGDLDGAAAIFETVLAEEHRNGFTVLLMTACQRDTVRDAQRDLASQQLYLVTKKVAGRGCFRVCAGTYSSREAAGRALAELPGAYRSAGAAVRPVADVLSRDR